MTLPLRLRERRHEPAHGALLRLCARSGRTVVSSIASSLGLPLREILAGRHVESLAELAGVAPTPLSWWSPVIATADRVVAVAGEELSLGDWSVATRRHCPECLGADVRDAAAASVPPDWLASHRSWWDVRSVAACPEHGVALVDACPACSSPLGWRDARRLACPRCGGDLLARAEQLDDPLGRYVAARLGIGRVERLAVLDDLPLRQAVRLCGKLGRAGLDADPAPTAAGVPPPGVGAEGLRRAALGARGLDDVFDRAVARRAADAPDGLGAAYGWIHDEWLGTDDPAAGPYREALRRHAVANGIMARDEDRLGSTAPATISLTRAAAEAGVAFARMRRLLDDADAIPSGSRRGVAFALDLDTVAVVSPRPRGALHRAAREVLGVGRTALAGLAGAGLVDLTEGDPSHVSINQLARRVGHSPRWLSEVIPLLPGVDPTAVARTGLVRMRQVRLIERALDGLIRQPDTADLLGIDLEHLDALRVAGSLRFLRSPTRNQVGLLLKEDVLRLAKLLDSFPVVVEPAGMQDLRSAARGGRVSAADLMVGVVDGRVVPSARLAGTRGFAGLLFEPSAVRSLLLQLHDEVDMRALGRLLGWNVGTLPALKKLGHVDARSRKGVDLGSVERFRVDYASCGEMRQWLLEPAGPQALLAEVRRRGLVSIVSGPCITPLFSRRAAAAQLRPLMRVDAEIHATGVRVQL